MSIEQTLERIAVALESIALSISNGGEAGPMKDVKPIKETKAPRAAPVKVVEEDPFGVNQTQEVEITLEDITEVLTKHAKAFGTKVTLEMMKKHGANQQTPKINTIPEANYAKVKAEAEKDLAKKG